MGHRSGFVIIIGRPNVGKSTLVNRLANEKVSIISKKPQTTRNTIKAIITEQDCQIVIMDTPGIHKPKNKLDEYTVRTARDTMHGVDIIVFMVEAFNEKPGSGDLFIVEQLKKIETPVLLVINKIDLIRKEQILPLISNYRGLMNFTDIIPVSALNNEGVCIIMEDIKKILPEGPEYFPADMITDQPERVIVAEIIREKILKLINDEVPHGVGVDVFMFKERENKNIMDIQANIYCEKDSHKGILIGKDGKMLKKIGTLAREEIELLLGTKVFLELWIKIKPDWRNSETMLKTLGYFRQD